MVNEFFVEKLRKMGVNETIGHFIYLVYFKGNPLLLEFFQHKSK